MGAAFLFRHGNLHDGILCSVICEAAAHGVYLARTGDVELHWRVPFSYGENYAIIIPSGICLFCLEVPVIFIAVYSYVMPAIL